MPDMRRNDPALPLVVVVADLAMCHSVNSGTDQDMAPIRSGGFDGGLDELETRRPRQRPKHGRTGKRYC